MIWHSFLLNPGTYNARCAAGTSCFIDIAFPWINVVSITLFTRCLTVDSSLFVLLLTVPFQHRAINARDRTFTLLPSAASSFKLNTGHEADLLAFLSSEDMAYRIDKSNFKSGHQLDGNVVFNRLQNALVSCHAFPRFTLRNPETASINDVHLSAISPCTNIST